MALGGIIGTIAWVVIFLVDVIDIMAHLKKDEREKIHEAMAERNALWGIMAILVLGILYQVIQSAFEEKIIFDWWIFAALFIGLTIKSISNIYLDRKN